MRLQQVGDWGTEARLLVSRQRILEVEQVCIDAPVPDLPGPLRAIGAAEQE